MTAATDAILLHRPRVQYTSSESQFDAMMRWRADLELSYLVASESGCKSTGRFAASWVSIRAGELK